MLTIEAPVKVISEANQRGNWKARHFRGTSQKTEMQYYWRQALKGRKVTLPCIVRLTRIGPKALDSDNLAGAFKAVRDQIAAEIGIDDGASQIKFEYSQEAIGARKYSIRVEVIEESAVQAA